MLGDLWNAIKTVVRWLLIVCTHPAWGTLNATRFQYRDQIWPLAILAILAVARLLVSGTTPSSVFLLFFLLSTTVLSICVESWIAPWSGSMRLLSRWRGTGTNSDLWDRD